VVLLLHLGRLVAGCRRSHCACQNRFPPANVPGPRPPTKPNTRLPPIHPPKQREGTLQAPPFISLSPPHFASFSSTFPLPLLLLTSPLPPLAGPQPPKTCGLLARPAASCQFYERDGLRRPLDNGCSLMRSRNGRIEVVKTAPTLPTIFVTTLL